MSFFSSWYMVSILENPNIQMISIKILEIKHKEV